MQSIPARQKEPVTLPTDIVAPEGFQHETFMDGRSALEKYNSILIKINESSAPKTVEQISENRMQAASLFISKQGMCATRSLAFALRMVHGNWVNGEPAPEVIRKILFRLNSSMLNSLSGIIYYRANTAKFVSQTVKRHYEKNQGVMCLIHPTKSVVARGMCAKCYGKAFRLGILHLNLGEWLSVLLKRRKPSDSSHCVNHAEVASYADGHCVECLHRLGRLEKELVAL
jgi:hypothetical protein